MVIRDQSSAPPTRPGQLVRSDSGRLGITTDLPRKRTPTIPVQYVGHPYPVIEQIARLRVVADPEAASMKEGRLPTHPNPPHEGNSDT